MELKYKNHQPGLILTTKRQIFAMLNVLYKSAIRSRHHKYHKQYDTMLQMYCCNYGPLNTNEVTAENVWTWINDPWPWEGGGC